MHVRIVNIDAVYETGQGLFHRSGSLAGLLVMVVVGLRGVVGVAWIVVDEVEVVLEHGETILGLLEAGVAGCVAMEFAVWIGWQTKWINASVHVQEAA